MTVYIGPLAEIAAAVAGSGVRVDQMRLLNVGTWFPDSTTVFVGIEPTTKPINLASPVRNGEGEPQYGWVAYEGVDWVASDAKIFAVRVVAETA